MAEPTPYPDEVTLGDPASPVGLCTLWTRQERILRGVPRELYAACGNLYSLWGIGLLIRGMLARPTLRYLVVCGVDYADTGRALVALLAEGLAPDGTVPGTPTRLEPDLDAAAVARFRARVTLVDLRGCTDAARVAAAIRALPPPADAGEGAERPRVIVPAGWTPAPLAAAPPSLLEEAPPAGWQPDPLGNFLIAVERGRLAAVHATTTGGPTGHRFTGRTAAEVYLAILAAGLVSRLDHAAYLGAELARAEIALRAGLPYRQDTPLPHYPS
jgi:tetrahydromethanopterin S-methyltransferase subunit A